MELTKTDKAILARADLAKSAEQFKIACYTSRHYSELCKAYVAEYGEGNGRAISGCYRDHFPHEVKDRLRNMAQSIGIYSKLAYSYKPKGVQTATIAKLGRAIARRDGSGFYGPQG